MRSSPFAAVAVAASSFLFIIAIVCLAIAFGHDWLAMLRDRGIPDGTQPPFAGLMSDLGIFMLSAAIIIYAIDTIHHRRLTLLAFFTAALSAMIALDDYAMLHEGQYEKAFYASYMVAGVSLIVLQFRHALHESWLLMSALVFLGISMLADFAVPETGGRSVFGVTLWGLRALIEDVLKFTGYALLSAHLVAGAVDAFARKSHWVTAHR